jgi:hypothetical protein
MCHPDKVVTAKVVEGAVARKEMVGCEVVVADTTVMVAPMATVATEVVIWVDCMEVVAKVVPAAV